LTIAINGDSN